MTFQTMTAHAIQIARAARLMIPIMASPEQAEEVCGDERQRSDDDHHPQEARRSPPWADLRRLILRLRGRRAAAVADERLLGDFGAAATALHYAGSAGARPP